MAQNMIHQHQRQHSLDNGCCPNSDTGVMASVGDDFNFIVVNIQSPAGNSEAGCRFESGADKHILAA